MTKSIATNWNFLERFSHALYKFAPGLMLAGAVALFSFWAEPRLAYILKEATGWSYKLPAIVIALIAGMVLNGLASRPGVEPGVTWCVKKLLRIAIGLLGIRIAISDIIELGGTAVTLTVIAMTITVVTGVLFARTFNLGDGYGALAGAATAVCGASATLATATVVPNYPQKGADVAFTVIAANAVSTLAMIAYPPLCSLLGFDTQTTGIMLGATIHDMAQVVGAGYAMSEPVGNTAVVVKLFRVFLLLPVVLAIGWWFTRTGVSHGEAKVPVPVFALCFLLLCVLNSGMRLVPEWSVYYKPFQNMLIDLSTWGLLIAIAALGLGTSLRSLLRIGWRHMAVFSGTTIVILFVVLGGLSIAS